MRRSDEGCRWWRTRRIVLLTAYLVIQHGSVMAAPFGYVVNDDDGAVSVIDTASNLVVTTVTVGRQPLGTAVNGAGTCAYVTNENQVVPVGSVSVIDSSTNGVVAPVTVDGGPSGVAVKLPGDLAYVTNRDDRNVSVIDTTTNQVVSMLLLVLLAR